MAITLSQQAADHIKRFLSKSGEGKGLRLGVEKTGCSGWAYTVDPALEILASDKTFEDKGVTIVVDPQALALIDGSHVDFVQQGLNKNFVFDNPQVTEACGCGESFTIQAVS